jgi:hypothetical protein
MARLPSPFETLQSLQQALDGLRTSSWFDAGLSGGGADPPINVFRKGQDFAPIAELPGVKKSDIQVQLTGRIGSGGRYLLRSGGAAAGSGANERGWAATVPPSLGSPPRM